MKNGLLNFKHLLLAALSLGALVFTLVFFTGRPASAAYRQPASPLTLAERADCRTAIAAVYWADTDWPAVNAAPKPALRAVLSPAAVENQVTDTLAQTIALQNRWGVTVTPDMLQAEMERMVHHSQDPARLTELFAALGNDPTRIAECLVRPVLVDRLIRQQFGADRALHADAYAAAAGELAGIATAAELAALPNAETVVWTPDGDATPLPVDRLPAGELALSPAGFASRQAEIRQAFDLQPADALPLNQVSRLQENDGRFYALAVLSADDERLQAVYVTWPKRAFEAWWAGHKADFAVAEFAQPDFEYALPDLGAVTELGGGDSWHYLPAMPWITWGNQSVWTGSVMLVWGGNTNGFRYDPVLDDWRPITTLNAPWARSEFTAVWTGTEMIVYGGCNYGTEFCTDGSGGRYNPVTDSWEFIAFGAARREHTAVWTGSEMLVWGGCIEDPNGNQNCNTLVTQGARYNPATDTWSNMSLSGAPAGARYPESIWAGDQMILWNGSGVNGRYFPASNTWQSISTTNAPTALIPTLVWTGSEMIAWGGCTLNGVNQCAIPSADGGRYDPQTDTWTPTSSTGVPSARMIHSAVWTGSDMIVWGGTVGGGTFLNDGARYDPLADGWTPIASAGAPSPRGSQHAHWTGQVMIIWGGRGFGDERTGGRYNPASDSWLPTTTNDPYRRASQHASVWDGTQMIGWGGEGEQFIDPFYQRARLYDPATDVWSMSSQNEDLPYLWWPAAAWTGSEMIIWGGQYGSSIFPLGARYNPLTDSWVQTNLDGAPEGRGNHTGVWTGSELIIWGGSTQSELYVQTGGRYNPQTDSWQATSLSDAPTGRSYHQAAWTGSKMLIWGGNDATGFPVSGGRYDPATNSWTPMTTTDAPTGRVMFASVWTGTEFIVWSGGDYNTGWTYYQSGGRYDPVADTWTPTSLTGVPEGRARFTAVWTGQEMVAWGGCNDHNCLTDIHTGGRYDPATDSWALTSVDHVIEGREFHTMVWTGTSVLVWGGQTDRNGYTHIGARYDLTTPANLPPLAAGDIYTTTANVPLLVPAPGVLANDEDPDGGQIQAVLLTPALSGQVTLAGDGSFTYTPATNFTGQDTFTYRAFDGAAYSEPATVTIVVEPGAPPVEFQIFIPIARQQ